VRRARLYSFVTTISEPKCPTPPSTSSSSVPARRLCDGDPRRAARLQDRDRRARLLGGICSNWGCIPTKALLRSAEIFHYMQHAKDYGLSARTCRFDPAAVIKRSRAVAGA
jgi:hypothetical protein